MNRLTLNTVLSVLFLLRFCALDSLGADGPESALKRYFVAVEAADKVALSATIVGSKEYREEFAKVVDVKIALDRLGELLGDKYQVDMSKRYSFDRQLGLLSEGVGDRKFKIDGARASSIPKKGEVPVKLLLFEGRWLLDFRNGLSDAALAVQAQTLGKTMDATLATAKTLIGKIDTLDTNKFGYEDAWKIVNINIKRSVAKKLGIPSTADR